MHARCLSVHPSSHAGIILKLMKAETYPSGFWQRPASVYRMLFCIRSLPMFLLFRHGTLTFASAFNLIRPSPAHRTTRPPLFTARYRWSTAVRRPSATAETCSYTGHLSKVLHVWLSHPKGLETTGSSKFLHAECPLCEPPSSVKALKGTQSTEVIVVHYGHPMEQGRPLYFHPVVRSSFFLA